jgi:hypothetical protein
VKEVMSQEVRDARRDCVGGVDGAVDLSEPADVSKLSWEEGLGSVDEEPGSSAGPHGAEALNRRISRAGNDRLDILS